MEDQETLKQARDRTMEVVRHMISQQAMTIAAAGQDKDQFGAVFREALLANPEIVGTNELALGVAVKKCCQWGLVPDGDLAALVCYRNKKTGDKEASAIPMVTGIQKSAYEDLGAEIRSGVVYEGDSVVVTEGFGGDVEPSIQIKGGASIFLSRTSTNIIGAWCWIKLPFEEKPRLVIFSKDQIERAKAASAAQYGPWLTWPERMAEKSCVKSAIWRLRYMIRSRKKGERLLKIIQDDNEAEYGTAEVPDAEFQDVGSAKVEVRQLEEDKTPVVPLEVAENRAETEKETVKAEKSDGDDGFLPSVDDDPTAL